MGFQSHHFLIKDFRLTWYIDNCNVVIRFEQPSLDSFTTFNDLTRNLSRSIKLHGISHLSLERKMYKFNGWTRVKTDHNSKNIQLIPLNDFKFGYSEKATKFEKIFHLKFDVTENIRTLTRNLYSVNEGAWNFLCDWVHGRKVYKVKNC